MLVIKNKNEASKGGNYWKFNVTLLADTNYNTEMDSNFTRWGQEHAGLNPQLKWEIYKYEIRKFSMKFAKKKAKLKRDRLEKLEAILGNFEKNPTNQDQDIFDHAKNEFELIKQEEVLGQILRSKCNWYENGEKSSKYFLNLEKFNAKQCAISCLINEQNTELNNTQEILSEIDRFYSSLFKKNMNASRASCAEFLSSLNLPTLTDEQKIFCDLDFTCDDLLETVTSMQGGKSPGNDGIGKEFYIHFWDKIATTMFNSFMDAKIKGTLSASQKQAIIKLLAKKDRDRRYIGNWRPISLLNVDTKILSKTISSKLKVVLPDLIKSDQTAYVAGRFIGESSRLISDLIEITKSLDMDGWLITMDIQKAFDSVDHDFMFSTLERAGFGPAFLNWIKILVLNQESCVYNAGTSTRYFNLERGCRQGDPISAYLFILVIEVFFTMVRANNAIEGLKILDFEYKLDFLCR